MKVNKYDAYVFVLKALKSCKTDTQLTNARKLIEYHFDLYEDMWLREELFDTFMECLM